MINCIINGRMTKNPELRKVTVGGIETSVIDFTVAADNGYRRDADGNKKNPPQFFRVTAWRGAADAIAKYGAKGREITVTGAVELRNYIDPQTQQKMPYMAIPRLEQFEFHGNMNAAPTADAAPVATAEEAPAEEPNLPW